MIVRQLMVNLENNKIEFRETRIIIIEFKMFELNVIRLTKQLIFSKQIFY